MAWTPIVGKQMSIPEFQKYVNGLRFDNWRPSFVVLHNTGAPSLAGWMGYPVNKRIENLVDYYKRLGWSAGPHAFIDDKKIIPFTPLNVRGVHSPSWNGTALGIECVGDYAREAFDSGPGAKVRDNAVAALAIIHAKLGLDPETIKLHKEDRRTTHDCPGKNVKKADIIRRVQEYMGHAGEHVTEDEEVIILPQPRVGTTNTSGLNLRASPSASSKVISVLDKGIRLAVLGEAMNGDTKWLHVKAGKEGWTAARFVTV